VEANEVPRQPTLQPAAYLNIAENKLQKRQQQRPCGSGSGKNPGPGGRVSADGATVRSRALHTLVAFFTPLPVAQLLGCSSPFLLVVFGRLAERLPPTESESAGQQTAAFRVICPPFCTIARFRLATLLPVTVFAPVFCPAIVLPASRKNKRRLRPGFKDPMP